MPMDVRTGGRIAAALVLTGVVALVVWSIRTQPTSAVPSQPSPPAAGAPPVTLSGPRAGATGIAGSGKGSWTRANPRTGAVESRLDYDRLAPLAGGRYELDRPGAWFFSGGEARAHVSAPTARVVWPSRNEPPEAGDMSGGVTVRVFPSGAAPAGETPPLDTAIYTLSIDSVHFEGAMSQIESADPLRVRGPGLEADSSGLVLRISPAGNRVEYFRTLAGAATISPEALRESSRRLAPPQPADTTSDTPKQPAAPGDTQAIDQPYQFALQGAVSIDQASLGVRAGMLRVWAMMRDGRLPENAVADFRPAGSDRSQPSGATSKPVDGKDVSAPIRITWATQLELRSLPDRPDQLRDDLLSARLEAEDAANVTVTDTSRGVSIAAGAIEYGATTRRTSIISAPGKQVALAFAGDGDPDAAATYHGSGISIDLTTGVGAVDGPGSVSLGDRSRSALSWTQRADVLLDTSNGPAGAGGAVIPSRVTIAGGVRAISPDGSATAGWADARFTRAVTRDGKPFAWASQIELKDGASVENPDGSLSAASLSLRLDAPRENERRAVPSHISARGGVIGQQDGELLTADSLDAALVTEGDSRRQRIGNATAEGRVQYRGGDGVIAEADRLEAEVPAKRLTLRGSPAQVGRGILLSLTGPPESDNDREQTRVFGDVIEIDGIAKRLTVPTGGNAERTALANGPEQFSLNWRRGLMYDDTTGRAEVVGAVKIGAKRGETDAYAAICERAVVGLAPASHADHGGRTLNSVTLFGESTSGEPSPISVQARRYSGLGASRRLEGLIDLRGAEVTVSPDARTVGIPGPGRIILEDRRSLEGDESRAADELRGNSVIDWKDGMTTDEATGVIRVSGGVRVRHLAPGAAEATLIESGTLGVGLIWPGENDADQQPRLKSIGGDGGVYVKHQRLQLTGSSIAYDADRGIVIVEGPSDRPVTVQDSQTGTTTTAEAVELDPRSGTWRATRAGTIVVPR